MTASFIKKAILISEEEKEALLKALLYLIKQDFSSTLILLQHKIHSIIEA